MQHVKTFKLFLHLHCATKVHKAHADRVPYILKLVTVKKIKDDPSFGFLLSYIAAV